MPWRPEDVARHNKKAGMSGKKSRQWSAVANKIMEQTGNEGRAVRGANAAVRRNRRGR